MFANPQFQSRGAFDSAAEQSRSAMLRLVVALAASSIAAAASSRLVEKLMPFYGGTTSFDDVTLFDLFQRVELVGGTSVAVAFRQWDPSLDQSPLESTRAAALAALQNTYIRRCWTRACASSRTKLSKEHNEATYDPNFILAYLRQTLVDDELKPQEWTGILESGVLGVALTGLASSAASVRLLSRATLATALKKVEVRLPGCLTCSLMDLSNSCLRRYRPAPSEKRKKCFLSCYRRRTASSALLAKPFPL